MEAACAVLPLHTGTSTPLWNQLHKPTLPTSVPQIIRWAQLRYFQYIWTHEYGLWTSYINHHYPFQHPDNKVSKVLVLPVQIEIFILPWNQSHKPSLHTSAPQIIVSKDVDTSGTYENLSTTVKSAPQTIYHRIRFSNFRYIWDLYTTVGLDTYFSTADDKVSKVFLYFRCIRKPLHHCGNQLHRPTVPTSEPQV